MADRIRFYTDEHISFAITKALRREGANVLTAQEAGLLSADDLKHMKRARHEKRVIVTQDADFLGHHRCGVPHFGIAYAPKRTPIGRMVRGLLLIYEALSPEDMVNRLEFL